MSTTARQTNDDKEMTQILSSIRRMIIDDLIPDAQARPSAAHGQANGSLARGDHQSMPSPEAPDALPLTRLLRDDGSVVTLPLPHGDGTVVAHQEVPSLSHDMSDVGGLTHPEPRVFYGFKPDSVADAAGEAPATPQEEATYPWPTHDDGQARMDHAFFPLPDGGPGSVADHGGEQGPSDTPLDDGFGLEWQTAPEGEVAPHSWGGDRQGVDHDPSSFVHSVDSVANSPLTPQDGSDLWVDGSVQAQTHRALDSLLSAHRGASDADLGGIASTAGGAGGQSTTLDGFIRGLLKPMMKDWLDRHLPDIVERQVRVQIEALMRQRK